MRLYEVFVNTHEQGQLAQCDTEEEAITLVKELTGASTVEKVIRLV